MPFDFVKKWFFDMELKKDVKITEDNGSSIGIYIPYTADVHQIEAIYTFIGSHGTKREDIHILSFASQKEPIPTSTMPVYTLKDLKWSGFPQNDGVLNFISRRYKRFYYLCPSYLGHQKYIVSKIKADFKAGVYSNGIEKLLDLTLDNTFASPLESLKEIYGTISKLRSKKQ
jgi:hypothetical protein